MFFEAQPSISQVIRLDTIAPGAYVARFSGHRTGSNCPRGHKFLNTCISYVHNTLTRSFPLSLSRSIFLSLFHTCCFRFLKVTTIGQLRVREKDPGYSTTYRYLIYIDWRLQPVPSYGRAEINDKHKWK